MSWLSGRADQSPSLTFLISPIDSRAGLPFIRLPVLDGAEQIWTALLSHELLSHMSEYWVVRWKHIHWEAIQGQVWPASFCRGLVRYLFCWSVNSCENIKTGHVVKHEVVWQPFWMKSFCKQKIHWAEQSHAKLLEHIDDLGASTNTYLVSNDPSSILKARKFILTSGKVLLALFFSLLNYW